MLDIQHVDVQTTYEGTCQSNCDYSCYETSSNYDDYDTPYEDFFEFFLGEDFFGDGFFGFDGDFFDEDGIEEGTRAGAVASIASLAALTPPPLAMFPPLGLPQPLGLQPGSLNVLGGGALPTAAVTVSLNISENL